MGCSHIAVPRHFTTTTRIFFLSFFHLFTAPDPSYCLLLAILLLLLRVARRGSAGTYSPTSTLGGVVYHCSRAACEGWTPAACTSLDAAHANGRDCPCPLLGACASRDRCRRLPVAVAGRGSWTPPRGSRPARSTCLPHGTAVRAPAARPQLPAWC